MIIMLVYSCTNKKIFFSGLKVVILILRYQYNFQILKVATN